MKAAEAKEKRIELLKQIDVLDKDRCDVCAGDNAGHESTRCKCPAAVAIRKLGVEYESIATASRKGRISALLRQGRKEGLTLELYTALRELELNNEQIYKGIRMQERDYYDWKFEVGLIKERRPARRKAVQKRPAVAPEKVGLTAAAYKDAKQIGFTDAEICKKYKISKIGLLKFKKENGLALPRGQHSKYPEPKKVAGGN